MSVTRSNSSIYSDPLSTVNISLLEDTLSLFRHGKPQFTLNWFGMHICTYG